MFWSNRSRRTVPDRSRPAECRLAADSSRSRAGPAQRHMNIGRHVRHQLTLLTRSCGMRMTTSPAPCAAAAPPGRARTRTDRARTPGRRLQPDILGQSILHHVSSGKKYAANLSCLSPSPGSEGPVAHDLTLRASGDGWRHGVAGLMAARRAAVRTRAAVRGRHAWPLGRSRGCRRAPGSTVSCLGAAAIRLLRGLREWAGGMRFDQATGGTCSTPRWAAPGRTRTRSGGAVSGGRLRPSLRLADLGAEDGRRASCELGAVEVTRDVAVEAEADGAALLAHDDHHRVGFLGDAEAAR